MNQEKSTTPVKFKQLKLKSPRQHLLHRHRKHKDSSGPQEPDESPLKDYPFHDDTIISFIQNQLQQQSPSSNPDELITLDLLSSTQDKHKLHHIGSLLEPYRNLEHLNCNGNQLGRIEGLSSLARLKTLELKCNNIRKIENIWQLKQLQHLNLSGNFISSIPTAIHHLVALETFNVQGNSLSKVKDFVHLSSLANLHALDFRTNPVCEVPNALQFVIFHLPCLERINDRAISMDMRKKSRIRFSTLQDAEKIEQMDNAFALQTQQTSEHTASLERSNERLKQELELKSELLNNKTREWSEATQKLVLLEQQLAMLRIDQSLYFPSEPPPVPEKTSPEQGDNNQLDAEPFMNEKKVMPQEDKQERGEEKGKLQITIPSTPPPNEPEDNTDIISTHVTQEMSSLEEAQSRIKFQLENVHVDLAIAREELAAAANDIDFSTADDKDEKRNTIEAADLGKQILSLHQQEQNHEQQIINLTREMLESDKYATLGETKSTNFTFELRRLSTELRTIQTKKKELNRQFQATTKPTKLHQLQESVRFIQQQIESFEGEYQENQQLLDVYYHKQPKHSKPKYQTPFQIAATLTTDSPRPTRLRTPVPSTKEIGISCHLQTIPQQINAGTSTSDLIPTKAQQTDTFFLTRTASTNTLPLPELETPSKRIKTTATNTLSLKTLLPTSRDLKDASTNTAPPQKELVSQHKTESQAETQTKKLKPAEIVIKDEPVPVIQEEDAEQEDWSCYFYESMYKLKESEEHVLLNCKADHQEDLTLDVRLKLALRRLEMDYQIENLDANKGIGLGDNQTSLAFVEIGVISAKNLPVTKSYSNSTDSYVTISLKNQKQIPTARTTTQASTLYPSWNECFTLKHIPALNSTILVQVMSENGYSGPDLIGKVEIPLLDYLDQRRHVDWFYFKPIKKANLQATNEAAGVKLRFRFIYSRIIKTKQLIDRLVQQYLSTNHELPSYITTTTDYEPSMPLSSPVESKMEYKTTPRSPKSLYTPKEITSPAKEMQPFPPQHLVTQRYADWNDHVKSAKSINPNIFKKTTHPKPDLDEPVTSGRYIGIGHQQSEHLKQMFARIDCNYYI